MKCDIQLEMRVRKLERSARMWRCGTIGLILIAAIVGLAPKSGEKEIECNKLVVKDQHSDSRIVLEYITNINGSAASIKFEDSNREKPFFILGNKDAMVANICGVSFMKLLDSPSIVCGDTTIMSGRIGIKSDTTQLAYFGLNKNGGGSLELNDAQGRPLVKAGATDPIGETSSIGTIRAFDPEGILAGGILQPHP